MKPFNVFPYDSNIDFMRMRVASLTVAAVLMFASIIAMMTQGFNFSLDFTGGVGVELRYAQKPNVDRVREQLVAAGFHGAEVQSFGSDHDLLIRLIRENLLTLPDETQVLPGHGRPTTIGVERATNPFLITA